jgi:hypothetical protein
MASCKAMESSFMARTKMYWDKGHPCRIPLSPGNFAKGCPFITTEKVADKTQEWIRFMK